jgi:hypothetical protein
MLRNYSVAAGRNVGEFAPWQLPVPNIRRLPAPISSLHPLYQFGLPAPFRLPYNRN